MLFSSFNSFKNLTPETSLLFAHLCKRNEYLHYLLIFDCQTFPLVKYGWPKIFQYPPQTASQKVH